jgi:hypothetical protein
VGTQSALDKDKTKNNSLTFANQYYYLRMGYAGTGTLPFFGQDTTLTPGNLSKEDIADASYGTSNYNYLKIIKDDSYKIDLSNVLNKSTAADVNLFAKFQKGTGANATPSDSFMEAKLIFDIIGDGTTIKEYKTILSANPDTTCVYKLNHSVADCAESAITATNFSALPTGDYAWSINGLLNSWRTQVATIQQVTTNKTKVTLVLKPFYHDAVIGISSNSCGTIGGSCDSTAKTVVPGPYTTVSSVGTYKGVYRTLEANIDRQSGSLYDLYDYVIYKAK